MAALRPQSPETMPVATWSADYRHTRRPEEPDRREPPRARERVWGARLVVLLLIAGAVALGYRQIAERRVRQSRVPLGAITLTADPVDVLSRTTGTVNRVLVDAQQRVDLGQPLYDIESIRSDGSTEETHVTAPVAGRVSSVAAKPGSSVRPGDLLLRMYEPERLYFQAELPKAELPKVSIGMRARLSVGSVRKVSARLVRSESRLRGEQEEPGMTTLVLIPEDMRRVVRLVPGLAFTGWLDAGSAPAGAPSGLTGE